ncbi:MAG: GNAT family N-acetyltransferase [Pasteurellaceae bacterium]|nr:GNAT family N-acetyltransferase [Pasteurellaceae bacterium]
MLARQLVVYYDKPPIELSADCVCLSSTNFHQAKQLLGQEFSSIYYDAREGLNLDALAIAVGTLRAGGTLHLALPTEPRCDQDSLRWSGERQPIFTPNFDRFFRQKLQHYLISTDDSYCQSSTDIILPSDLAPTPNAEQQHIIKQILQQQSEIYLLTAKRGRGKSTLLGFLTAELAKLGQRVIVTLANKTAGKNLFKFAEQQVLFIAPDELYAQIQQNSEQFAQDWLLVDEAAMIPLATLSAFTQTFRHLVFSTTLQSYEGTGRGFLLKFKPRLTRSFQHFELNLSLRWVENDPLEQFIDSLLLNDCEDHLVQSPFLPNECIQVSPLTSPELVSNIEQLYGLLTLAHYRTSPLDLRRLFDAPHQQLYWARSTNALIGILWLIEEGGITDKALIEQICRGERRPRGNLAAQMLAWQWHLPQACQLRSLRISRIAVQPHWQRNGIGQKLVQRLIEQTQVDFLSVSFGYDIELVKFWQVCGFQIVHIGEQREASSGCYNALALYGLSPQGKALVTQAKAHFERYFSLSFHPLVPQFTYNIDWQLNAQDEMILENFANFFRGLSASLGAIQRLMRVSDEQSYPLLKAYCSNPNDPEQIKQQGGYKNWLQACRGEVKNMLQQRMIEKRN